MAAGARQPIRRSCSRCAISAGRRAGSGARVGSRTKRLLRRRGGWVACVRPTARWGTFKPQEGQNFPHLGSGSGVDPGPALNARLAASAQRTLPARWARDIARARQPRGGRQQHARDFAMTPMRARKGFRRRPADRGRIRSAAQGCRRCRFLHPCRCRRRRDQQPRRVRERSGSDDRQRAGGDVGKGTARLARCGPAGCVPGCRAGPHVF
jgi:hypothetical protein